MHGGFDISFENIHKVHMKCTPKQIMLYQIAINLHRVINSESPLNFEKVTLLNQMICCRRQLRFEILRDFNNKIVMSNTASKFYHITNLIGLDMLNLSFVHFKKTAKI